jgi:hypothetical protein
MALRKHWTKPLEHRLTISKAPPFCDLCVLCAFFTLLAPSFEGALKGAVKSPSLKTWLLNNPIGPKKDVKTEYGIQGLSGSIDVLADGEAWELKKDQADGLDVYQLFAYLDMGGLQDGVLVAKDFTSGCESATQHITQAHGKRIRLEKLEKFPICTPMTDAEREAYL